MVYCQELTPPLFLSLPILPIRSVEIPILWWFLELVWSLPGSMGVMPLPASASLFQVSRKLRWVWLVGWVPRPSWVRFYQNISGRVTESGWGCDLSYDHGSSSNSCRTSPAKIRRGMTLRKSIFLLFLSWWPAWKWAKFGCCFTFCTYNYRFDKYKILINRYK